MRSPPLASPSFPHPESTYGERLLWAMAQRSLNQSDLARLTGVTPQAVQYLCDPTNNARGSRNTAAFAEACGVDPNWLARGTGAPRPEAEPHPDASAELGGQKLVPTHTDTRRVPVLSYEQASVMGGAGGLRLSQVDADYITTDRELSEQAFALEIQGDAMVAPPNSGGESFHEGDRIIVDCTVTPVPGDFVVARYGDQVATFKKYRPRGVDERGRDVYELVPLNPDHPVLRSDRQEVTLIGVMVEHRRYRKTK